MVGPSTILAAGSAARIAAEVTWKSARYAAASTGAPHHSTASSSFQISYAVLRLSPRIAEAKDPTRAANEAASWSVMVRFTITNETAMPRSPAVRASAWNLDRLLESRMSGFTNSRTDRAPSAWAASRSLIEWPARLIPGIAARAASAGIAASASVSAKHLMYLPRPT